MKYLMGIGLAALTLAAADLPAKPERPAPLALSPCQLQDPSGVSTVLAECGQVSVPEDPGDPSGRHMSLRVARVPAINRRKQPDPLFVLAGGPGMAATAFYASIPVAFERIHRDRDIVLLDQRGTGQSNALNCQLDESDLYRAAEVATEARNCLGVLQQKTRVEFYTTSVAVQDLDLVRSALGYRQINLYGASYGTRVAQHYVRRFPESARSVILDGVVPPQLALGPETALDAESALARIFKRCKDECAKRFGDVSAIYRALRDELKTHSVPVILADPSTGEPAKLEFTEFHLATVLRLGSYTAEQAALLPLMLHEAQASANFAPLASQFLLVNRSYGNVVAYGMHNTVVCSEDVPFWAAGQIDRAALEKTYLGAAQVDGLRNICSVWPRGPVDGDFHSPLHSDVPALLLSGSDDPVTPPADAELARRGFTRSIHVTLEGFGHGQLTAPCVDRVMAAFVQRGSVDELDVSCTHNDRPMPFFVTLGGPSP